MQRADSRFGTKTKMAAWAGALGLFAFSAWQLQSFEAGGGTGLRSSSTSSSAPSPVLSSGGGILSAGVQRVSLSPLARMRTEAPEAAVRAAPSLAPVGAAVPGAALEPLTGASKSSGGAASDAAQPRLVQSVEQRLYSGTNNAVESAHAAALETCSKTPDCSVASSTSRRTDGIFAGSIQMMVPPEAEAFVLGSIGGSLVLEQSSRTGADRTDEYTQQLTDESVRFAHPRP